METQSPAVEVDVTLTQRDVAEEIYNEINLSIQRLEEMYGRQSEHSLLVELRGERAMAFRALRRCSENELQQGVA